MASTCTGAGDERRLHGQIFRLVVLDEATQATEPSSFIPLLRGAESVVIAGDPKQLPPTVISPGAVDLGLQVTLFDRLQAAGEPLSSQCCKHQLFEVDSCVTTVPYTCAHACNAVGLLLAEAQANLVAQLVPWVCWQHSSCRHPML